MKLNPFNLKDYDSYSRWRDNKLKDYPSNLSELVVEIKDIKNISVRERKQIRHNIKKTNMSLYYSQDKTADKNIPVLLAKQLKIKNVNNNWLAQDYGITSLQVEKNNTNEFYIPYTDKAINWHTDGYYNDLDKQIYALNLHCVRPAPVGGKNRLMDHEIAYIKLRDENSDYIRVLQDKNAMSIPARTDTTGKIKRQIITGPVFSVNKNGVFHMRWTIRKKNIQWAQNDITAEAVAFLKKILDGNKYIFYDKLEAGMGLISNNILHTRDSFKDSTKQKRLLYRVRFYDTIPT
jgi:alpha-ketoglutarate-dependent taurine dioxygenase